MEGEDEIKVSHGHPPIKVKLENIKRGEQNEGFEECPIKFFSVPNVIDLEVPDEAGAGAGAGAGAAGAGAGAGAYSRYFMARLSLANPPGQPDAEPAAPTAAAP
eukprot:1233610-Prymnesium_polylepis.1